MRNLADSTAFIDYLAPLEDKKWHVYAKRPFGGPKAVLAYLARYTHRVAISNRRLLRPTRTASPSNSRITAIDGPGRYKTMTVHPHEFIRRFLIHVLPKGLHRIRHYGLLANGQREENLAKARALLRVKTIDPADDELRRRKSIPPLRHLRSLARAPAAAPACSSSRPSRAAHTRATEHHPIRHHRMDTS